MLQDVLRVFRHATTYAFGEFSSKIISFLMLPLYTRYLTPADYGVAAVIFMTTTLAGILWSSAVTGAMSRFYFIYKKENEKKELVSTSMIINFTLATTISLTGIIFSSTISNALFDTIQHSLLIKIAFATFMFDNILTFPLTILRLNEKSKKVTAINIARLITAVSLNIFFVVYLKMGITGILLSGLIVVVALTLILTPPLIINNGLKFSKNKIKPLFDYAWPIIPASLLGFILMSADVFILQKLSTSAQVGLFNSGQQIGMALVYLIDTPFFMIWGPFVLSSLEKKDMLPIFSRIQSYFLFVSLMGVLGLAMLAKPVINIVTGEAFHSAYIIVPILALAFFMRTLSGLFSTGMGIVKKTKYLAIISILGFVVNITINLILIPKMGFVGAAVAKLAAFSVMAILAYQISFKTYHIPIEKRMIGMFSLALVYYFVSTFITVNSILYQILIYLVLMATFPLVLYALRFFKDDEISKMKEIAKMIKSKTPADLKRMFNEQFHKVAGENK